MPVEYRIIVQTGPEKGKEIPLDKPEIGIGRDGHNEIVINDPEVSRYHAHLYLGDKGYLIEDKGSTNGTFVNTKRITNPTLLNDGDLILLGENINLVFESDALEKTVVGIAKHSPAKQPATAIPPIPAVSEGNAMSGVEEGSPSMIDNSENHPPELAPIPHSKRKLPTWAWVIIIAVIAIILLCVIPIGIIDLTNSWCNIFGKILHSINPTVCLPLP